MAGRVPLTGRDTERALITGLLDGTTARGAALVIRGTPGVGKSALLEWAAATVGDRFRVLRATGTTAEFGLPFAALHQILRPVLSHSIRLPRHRREALDVAFGKQSDSPPDLFSVAMAALDLIAEAAAKKPVLVLADDVHWMDPSSQQALAFIGRRISSDRVVLLATHRDGEEGSLADPAFASIDLAPLDRGSAAEILDRAANVPDTHTRTLITGLGEAAAYPSASIGLPVLDSIERYVVGENPFAIEKMMRRIQVPGGWHLAPREGDQPGDRGGRNGLLGHCRQGLRAAPGQPLRRPGPGPGRVLLLRQPDPPRPDRGR